MSEVDVKRRAEQAPDLDANRGWYRKYDVRRLNDRNGKHEGCEYFVLDLHHDPHAVAALRAYAESCAATYPYLAEEIQQRLPAIERRIRGL